MRIPVSCSRTSACLWRWGEPSDLPEVLRFHFFGVVWRFFIWFGILLLRDKSGVWGHPWTNENAVQLFVTLLVTMYSIKLKSHKFLSPETIAISGFSPLLYFGLSHRRFKFWHFFVSWILCNQLRCKFSISLANINFRWYAKPVETSESFLSTIMGFGSGLLIAVICLNLF